MKGLKIIYPLVFSIIMFINFEANAITSDFAKVTGTLSYPRLSTALVLEPIIYITLVDVSPSQDSSGNIIARVTIVNPTLSPICFELRYNPTQVEPRHIYAVQARITDQGKVIFANTLPYPVITRGNPHKVNIVLTTK